MTGTNDRFINTIRMNAQLDRYEGAMLGVAIGDALGAPLEFMNAGEIQRKHGTVREMLGGGWLSVEPGEVTDDTQMTLAVAEGIAADGDNPYQMVGANFLRWFRTHPKDVGGCCAAVLSRMGRSDRIQLEDWLDAAKAHDKASNGGTAGNGALMRAVYPALYYQRDKALEAAVRIAQMTHWHKHSTLTVLYYTDAINTIVNSDLLSAEEAKEFAETKTADIRNMLPGDKVEPSGYCVSSLICAMNAIRDTDSFEDALVAAVNMGGDADTIGAITGGLAGAIYGASSIPLRWVNSLANQPNRKTVQLFYQSGGAAQQGNANTLGIRLIDLAHLAYRHHEQVK